MITNVGGPRFLCVDGLSNNRYVIAMTSSAGINVYYAIFDENFNYTLSFKTII
jgi:hypothetical protein